MQLFPCSPLLSLLERLPLEQLRPRFKLLLQLLEQLLQQLPRLSEDIFAVISALLDRVGGEEDTQIIGCLSIRLLPLLAGRYINEDDSTCLAAIGLIGDLYRAMALDNNPAASLTEIDNNAIVAALLGRLHIPDAASRDLLVPSFGALADMALCLRSDFRPYVEAVMRLLAEAASHMEVTNSVASLAELTKCVADTFSAVLQALHDEPSLVEAALPCMLTFLNRASREDEGQQINDDLLVSLCGLIGDLYHLFGGEEESLADCEAVRRLLELGAVSPAPRVRAVSDWAVRRRDSGEQTFFCFFAGV